MGRIIQKFLCSPLFQMLPQVVITLTNLGLTVLLLTTSPIQALLVLPMWFILGWYWVSILNYGQRGGMLFE